MLNPDRFTPGWIDRAIEAKLTQYDRVTVERAITEYNAAETAYNQATDVASDLIAPYRIIPVGLRHDTPASIRKLWAMMSWYEPLQNGHVGHTAREMFAVGQWNRAAAQYRAQTKRINKLVQAHNHTGDNDEQAIQL